MLRKLKTIAKKATTNKWIHADRRMRDRQARRLGTQSRITL